MKRRIRKAAALVLSLVMAFSLTCVPVAAANDGAYSDISKADACYDAAIYLKNAGYMIGTGNGRFSPDDSVSRGMAATVLYRMAGEPKVDEAASFSDLKTGRYDSDALVWAVQKEILTGYPDNTIQADRSVSGSEVNSILAGYAKSVGGFEWKGPADETAALSRSQFAIVVYELCKQMALASDGKITRISGLTELLTGYDMMAKEERGEKTTLTAYTSDGTAKNVVWASSDEGVATVSAEGVVWAKGAGKTEITASNSQGSMSVTVTVTENMTIDDVVDMYFASLLDLGDVTNMSAAELAEAGDRYFYIPHKTEGTDADIIDAAKNRTFTEQIAFYSKAEAYYKAALEADAGCKQAAAKLEELYAYRDLIKRLDPDGQGICFTWFSNRNSLSAEQMNAFAYDDVFFFAEPQYRGMDTLIAMVGNTETVEGIEQRIAVYRFNAIYLGKGGAYTEISRFYIDKATYPVYPRSMDIGIDYLKWSFDPEVVYTTDFKGPRCLGDYYASGWTNDNGQPVAPDYVSAMNCYNVALSNKGAFDLTACMKMAFWNYEGELAEKNDTLAFTYLVYGFYQGNNLHATQTNMPEGLLVMAKLFQSGVDGVEPDNEMAVTFYTYAYKSAQAMLGHNDEVEDEDMQAVMEEVQNALNGMGAALDDSIVIGTAADDFDVAFEQLLKPYIGMIETHLGVKGVK